MIKKLLLLCVLLGTWYWVSVFAAPQFASTVDNLIWIPGLSDTIRGKKAVLDGAITDIPSVNEVKSWALDFKEKFEDGITSTKDTIDSIRQWAEKAEDTYNSAKETYDELKETFSGAKQMLDDASEKIEQVQGVVNDVSALTGSGS